MLGYIKMSWLVYMSESTPFRSHKKLNYRQMQMLRAIIMGGSISNAARMLNVSQPAVSRMLTQTEAQLGLVLFKRVRGRLQPTEEVKVLFIEIDRAETLMERVNDLARELQDQRAGVLRLASTPSLGQFVAPAAIARFRQDHPDILTRFHLSPIETLIPEVIRGDVELGLTALPAEDPYLTSTSLGHGRMVAALPTGHPLTNQSTVSLADLSKTPHIVVGSRMPFGMLTLSAFEEAGLACNMIADVPWASIACALVNAGVGTAIVDEFSVMQQTWPNLVWRPLDTHIPIHLSVIQARNRPLSLVANTFLQVLRDMMQHGRFVI